MIFPVYLRDLEFIAVSFRGCNLREAYLSSANFSLSDFTDADLSGANLSSANFIGANFTNAHLENADLTFSSFMGANFTVAHLGGANLTNSRISLARFERADLAGSNLQMTEAVFAQAQQARGDAETLVGFLIEDFYEELEPTGRRETMGKLAHQDVAYYDGLPAGLMTPQTQGYRGMALVREGGALLAGDDVETGFRSIAQARETFEKLHAGGDTSEPVVYGLALSLVTPLFYSSLGGPGSKPDDMQNAAELLRPLVHGEGGSRRVKLTYADLLNSLSYLQENREDAVVMCEEARRILVGVGALDLSDLTATSLYADVTDSQATHLMALRRFDGAGRLEEEVYELAEKALARRPGDIRSLANRFYAAETLSRIASARHNYAAAGRYAVRSEQAGEEVVRFNPSDPGVWGLSKTA